MVNGLAVDFGGADLMPRKEATITIEAEGRDKGKIYYLREMSAVQVEKWAARAIIALTRGGVNIPPEVAAGGIASIAAIGYGALGGLQFAEVEPLLDDMMRCVVGITPDPATNATVRRPLQVDDDIEEVATILRLRAELFELHTGFSAAAALSTLVSQARAAAISANTSTSPEASE